MALYNRALVYGAANEIRKAIQDLNTVLAMPASPLKVKSAARQKLDRMQRETTGALRHCSTRVRLADRLNRSLSAYIHYRLLSKRRVIDATSKRTFGML